MRPIARPRGTREGSEKHSREYLGHSTGHGGAIMRRGIMRKGAAGRDIMGKAAANRAVGRCGSTAGCRVPAAGIVVVAAVLVASALMETVLVAGLELGVSVAEAESASPTASPAASPAASTGGGEKTILRIGSLQDADNLNPFIGYSTTSYEVYHLNYDLLVGYGPNGEVRPELAESWTTSEDGLTWTFKTRKGVTWQDGVAFTAKDVAFTYNYIIDNSLSAFSSYTTNIKEAVAVDDTTVEFHLSKPKPSMLRLWIPIVPEHVWSKIPGSKAEGSYENDPPIVGTGPFQTVEVKKGKYVRLQANKDYWKGAPHIDEVIFMVYTNQDTMTMDLRNGTIDVAYGVPVAQLDSLDKVAGIKAMAAEAKGLIELCMNCYDDPSSLGNPVLRDEAFRQAISWAVDKQKIVDTCMSGYADVGQSILVPSTDYAWTPTDAEKFGYDLEKAKQMLDAAGYTDTDGNGIRNDHNGGKDIKLRLWTRDESAEQQSAGKIILASFESIGLDVTLTVMNDGTISDSLYNMKGDTYAPDYDMYIWGWGGSADPDYLLAEFITKQIGMWNDCCWSNAEYDRLFQEESTQTDTTERAAQVTEMQRIFYQSAPYSVLYYPLDRIAYNTGKWTGWVPYPSDRGLVVMSGDNIDSYVQLKPKAAVAESSGSSSTVWIVVGVVAAVVVVVVIVVLVLRSRGRGRVAEEE